MWFEAAEGVAPEVTATGAGGLVRTKRVGPDADTDTDADTDADSGTVSGGTVSGSGNTA